MVRRKDHAQSDDGRQHLQGEKALCNVSRMIRRAGILTRRSYGLPRNWPLGSMHMAHGASMTDDAGNQLKLTLASIGGKSHSRSTWHDFFKGSLLLRGRRQNVLRVWRLH